MLRPTHLACAVALALASTVAFAQSAPPVVQPSGYAGLFDNMVAFGDSLSDDGNVSLGSGSTTIMRWTTNPGQTAVEDIGDFFGFSMGPSLGGGSNYAYGGAGVINNSPGTQAFVPTLPTQLSTYLAANGGHADPNALYALWGGANDILYNSTMALIFPSQFTSTVVAANLQSAAQTELGMIASLKQAGARYVMVFNIPDVGLTPEARSLGPTLAAQITGESIIYNNALNAGLAGTGISIIPVNTFGMMEELVADPSRFGFTNVTQPACTGGSGSSHDCLPAGTAGATTTYQSGTQNTYLFADGVHPTTAAHAMLAQYAESIITAPGAMSLLGEAPLQVNESLDHSIVNQATTSLAQAPGNGLRVWASYDYTHQRTDAQMDTPKSSNNANTLSIGADIHPADAVTAGLALTAGQQRDGFANGAGGFKMQDLLATGYAMWGWDQAYFGAIGSFGHLTYNNIDRNIPIGPTTLFESGTTSGSHLAFALTGGWWLNFGNWRTGPYADLSWQHIHVDGYSEHGDDASAMTFGRQDRHALIGTLGWQVAANLTMGGTTLHPFARIAFNHDDDADPRMITAGLVTMPGTFALPGFAPDKNWGSVGVGLAADFTPNFSGWIGYDGRFSDSSQRVNSLNLGAKFRF